MLHSSTFTLRGEGERNAGSRDANPFSLPLITPHLIISLSVFLVKGALFFLLCLFLFILESSPVNFQFVKLFSSFREK